MRPIQYLLLALLAGGVTIYLIRWRSRVSDRMMACALSLAASVGILVPDTATWAANAVDVGRGVDLVMYLGLFTLAYLWMLLYTKQRQQQHKMTKLVRSLAIEQARPAARVERRRAA